MHTGTLQVSLCINHCGTHDNKSLKDSQGLNKVVHIFLFGNQKLSQHIPPSMLKHSCNVYSAQRNSV